MFVEKLTPYYRHGVETPWGGDALRRVFGKDIPDDRTGEALEASTLPGMESRTGDGRTLTRAAGGELPLLLKLLDAREALSVQVHPGDAYAAAHGDGLGKEEAWLILEAEPGAKLVYGLTPGTDVRALSGREIEDHLRWVDVHPGDALYIPAGTVHAIGPGILLYEIQQSSSATYRFWDWGRLGADGKPRTLHWDKACDVARADVALTPTRGKTSDVPGGRVTRYLDTPRFTLDRLRVEGSMPLPQRDGFLFLTALCEGSLARGEERVAFVPGDTVYVYPGTDGVTVEAAGDVIVSGEGRGE